MTDDEIDDVLNPPNPSIPQMCVDVRTACGRQYLNVFGVTVAVEGDLCRDCRTEGRQWDGVNLEVAAATIRRRLIHIIKALGPHATPL
jgi:hypothetical protein